MANPWNIPPQIRHEMRQVVEAICQEHLGPCIAELERLRAENAALRRGLERIRDVRPPVLMSWAREMARQTLEEVDGKEET